MVGSLCRATTTFSCEGWVKTQKNLCRKKFCRDEDYDYSLDAESYNDDDYVSIDEAPRPQLPGAGTVPAACDNAMQHACGSANLSKRKKSTIESCRGCLHRSKQEMQLFGCKARHFGTFCAEMMRNRNSSNGNYDKL